MFRIKYTKAYRQGEILIFKVDKIPYISLSKPKIIKNNVIREGEKSGHMHQLDNNAQLSMFDDETGIINASKDTVLTHPEHGDIKLPKGDYVVKIQKEATGKNKHQSVKD